MLSENTPEFSAAASLEVCVRVSSAAAKLKNENRYFYIVVPNRKRWMQDAYFVFLKLSINFYNRVLHNVNMSGSADAIAKAVSFSQQPQYVLLWHNSMKSKIISHSGHCLYVMRLTWFQNNFLFTVLGFTGHMRWGGKQLLELGYDNNLSTTKTLYRSLSSLFPVHVWIKCALKRSKWCAQQSELRKTKIIWYPNFSIPDACISSVQSTCSISMALTFALL